MTSTESRERARTKLGELRQSFAERLQSRLRQLDGLVTHAKADPTQGALTEAINAAHRLAGTAGSYGFMEVGEAAGCLERSLQRIAGGEEEWEAASAALARAHRSAS
ncbi:MAG: Hpt domain-containing protein [Deltaproteobacteria bacterium]|nr:Hpt domain-containing protein [Deltaproteobacteria bacterium]